MQPAGAEAGEIQGCLNLHYTVLYRYYVEFLIYNVLCCNSVCFFPPIASHWVASFFFIYVQL